MGFVRSRGFHPPDTATLAQPMQSVPVKVPKTGDAAFPERFDCEISPDDYEVSCDAGC
jgi:hypothetical protein